MEVILVWNEKENKWHMMWDDEQKTFIQEFYNCENMQKAFPDLHKSKQNKYSVKIRRLS